MFYFSFEILKVILLIYILVDLCNELIRFLKDLNIFKSRVWGTKNFVLKMWTIASTPISLY